MPTANTILTMNNKTEFIPVSEYRKMLKSGFDHLICAGTKSGVGPGIAEQIEKPKKKQGHYEADLQTKCVDWFNATYPHLQDLLFHIPNGGHRNAIEAAHLKRQGVVAGIPDLELAIPKPLQKKGNLFIEMKYGKNKESALQIDKRQKLQAVGNVCVVCYSFGEFQNIIREWLKETIYQPEIHIVIESICEVFGMTWEDITKGRRTLMKIYAKYIFSRYCRNKLHLNDNDTGNLVNRDRCTVIYSAKKYEDEYSTNKDFRELVDRFNAVLKIKQNKSIL